MATFTAVEQRAYIKIEYYRDTKRVKILNTLKSVCGKDALPKTTVYRWPEKTNEWTDEFKKGILLRHKAGQEGRGEILLENSFMR